MVSHGIELNKNIDIQTDSQTAFVAWLGEQASEHHLTYLLSYHDNGVVWGRFDGDQWYFSGEAFGELTSFRLQTLQSCRLFGSSAQLQLHRYEAKAWKASVIKEVHEPNEEVFFDRHQLLWGNRSIESDTDKQFTKIKEGSRGLIHAVPLLGKPRFRLVVRNYVAYDEETHHAYVAFSRLTTIEEAPDAQTE